MPTERFSDNPFEVGQWVVCLEGRYALLAGKAYHVQALETSYDSRPMILIAVTRDDNIVVNRKYYVHRFRALKDCASERRKLGIPTDA